MEWPNSSYLWNPRLLWSCLQGMLSMWQGRLLSWSGSGSILGFSGRNLLWCTLPSPFLIVMASFSVCDSRHSWLVHHRAIAFDMWGSYVRPICKRERDVWGEKGRNHSLQMCEAQALLKGNMWESNGMKYVRSDISLRMLFPHF